MALTDDVADGFAVTPFARSDLLSAAVGGDVWVKDETGNVGGSHKGRHLVTILLHLRAAEALAAGRSGSRRPLAIASCGNAAIAAATLAAAGRVADRGVRAGLGRAEAVLDTLERARRDGHRCPRRATDPPGDPGRPAVPRGGRRRAPSRSACRARRTRCASTAGARIGWELADAGGRPRPGRGPGRRRGLRRRASGGGWGRACGSTRCRPRGARRSPGRGASGRRRP